MHVRARALPGFAPRQRWLAAGSFDFAQDDAVKKLVKLKHERVSLHSGRRAHGF
jgi:hypothetical protein